VSSAPLRVPRPGGELVGHRSGIGFPALLLHGGPAFNDYTEGLAAELGGLFELARYTQRGVEPSTLGPPYTVKSHTDDAIAVLDHLDLDGAWIIGHSWGGHLALHLLVTHPERVRGVIGVDPLGARADVFPVFGENLRRGLDEESIARIDEAEAKRRRGEATEADLLERVRLLWPQYFADPAAAPPLPDGLKIGLRCSTDTDASIDEHFGRGTLERGLPRAPHRPVLFVHADRDPLALRGVTETAALISDARVEVIEGCGHFPWMERPGEVERAVRAFLGA